jgi:hypothetical protein
MNKYNQWYHSIIENARSRTLSGYKESHHIVPQSLGGPDTKENLVDLTAREHFVCHWLLVKMHTGEARSKMIYALNGMKRSNREQERYETAITSRVYQKLKEEFGKTHSAFMKGRQAHNKGKPMSEEQKAKIRATKASNPYKYTPEQIAKRVEKQVGQKRSQESKDKISAALKGKLKGPMSDENKVKISLGSKGKTKPEGFGNKVALRMQQKFRDNNPNQREDLKKICPHCGGKFGPSNFTRWHGDRCRTLNN